MSFNAPYKKLMMFHIIGETPDEGFPTQKHSGGVFCAPRPALAYALKALRLCLKHRNFLKKID